MDTLLKSYLRSIADLTQRGDAGEERYYSGIVTAIARTIDIQGQIEPLYAQAEARVLP